MTRYTLHAPPWTRSACVVLPALLMAACGTTPRLTGPGDAGTGPPTAAAPSVDDGFVVAAHELDAWNAVGQLIVRTDGMRLDARSEMLDLHAVRYRGQDFLVLTRGIPLAQGAREPTTRVSAIAQDGAAVDTAATRELLAMLRRELPAEIARVRALQATKPEPRQD